MKTTLCITLAVVLTSAGLATAHEGQTVKLWLKPEREYVLKGKDTEVILKIEVETDEVKGPRRSPLNLSVVLDRSGSMSGAKLEKAKQGAAMVLDQLSKRDCFSLVTYDNKVKVVVDPRRVKDRDFLKAKIWPINSGGSTALYAGVRQGSDLLREYLDEDNINRVILLSDGLANIGPKSPSELADLGKKLRRQGMNITTIGLGDDYNEDLMVALAEASGANYYYVEDTEKLPDIFVEELGQLSRVAARDTRIIIKLPKGVKPVEVIGYQEECRINGAEVEIDAGELYGSQNRYYLLRCNLKDQDRDELKVASVRVNYRDEIRGMDDVVDGSARVKLTSNRDKSDESVDKEIGRKVAAMDNLCTRRRALKLADEGRTNEAAQILRSQISTNAINATFYSDDRFLEENGRLLETCNELERKGALGKAGRKKFQYDNYNGMKQKGGNMSLQ